MRASRALGRPGLGALSHGCQVHVESGGRDGALLAAGRLSVSVAGPAAITAGREPGR